MPGSNHSSLTAKNADKFELYQKSVQTAEDDARFISRRFQQLTGRPLRLLREDFCGTAQLLCEFVKLHGENRGFGIDLDERPLNWCKTHNIAKLSPAQQQRITLLRENVKQVRKPRADLAIAFNFSYAAFKQRRQLSDYFKTVHSALKPDGIFMIDSIGGREVPEVGNDVWSVGRFKYIWEVAHFDPITHHQLCKIHFLFRDGSQIRDAFVYDWRLWTLPELQELLQEAGFGEIQVLWEGTDPKSNLGNGVMRRVDKGAYQGAWYAILVARKLPRRQERQLRNSDGESI